MTSELEQALLTEVDEAQQAHDEAIARLEAEEEATLVIIEKAKAERNQRLEAQRNAEKQLRERLRRAERALKVIRGEKLTKGWTEQARKAGGTTKGSSKPESEKKIRRVWAGVQELERRGEPVTVARIRNITVEENGERGIGWDVVERCLDELRNREMVRKLGRISSGSTKTTGYASMKGETSGRETEEGAATDAQS